jgi:beta-xylosidase
LVEGAYELWRYPDDWVVEMYAPEGPKFFWKDGYLYLVAAVGGTLAVLTQARQLGTGRVGSSARKAVRADATVG